MMINNFSKCSKIFLCFNTLHQKNIGKIRLIKNVLKSKFSLSLSCSNQINRYSYSFVQLLQLCYIITSDKIWITNIFIDRDFLKKISECFFVSQNLQLLFLLLLLLMHYPSNLHLELNRSLIVEC